MYIQLELGQKYTQKIESIAYIGIYFFSYLMDTIDFLVGFHAVYHWWYVAFAIQFIATDIRDRIEQLKR